MPSTWTSQAASHPLHIFIPISSLKLFCTEAIECNDRNCGFSGLVDMDSTVLHVFPAMWTRASYLTSSDLHVFISKKGLLCLCHSFLKMINNNNSGKVERGLNASHLLDHLIPIRNLLGKCSYPIFRWENGRKGRKCPYWKASRQFRDRAGTPAHIAWLLKPCSSHSDSCLSCMLSRAMWVWALCLPGSGEALNMRCFLRFPVSYSKPWEPDIFQNSNTLDFRKAIQDL